MQPTARERVYVAFERPALDPDVRPAMVPLPDPVRFPAWIEGTGKALIVVSIETVADHMELDRPPLWCDFDSIWGDIARAAERRACEGRFDAQPDARTGLPRIMLLGADLAYGRGSANR